MIKRSEIEEDVKLLFCREKNNDDSIDTLSEKEINKLVDILEQRKGIYIYPEDVDKWSRIKDIVNTVEEALTEQGYTVVSDEEIEEI